MFGRKRIRELEERLKIIYDFTVVAFGNNDAEYLMGVIEKINKRSDKNVNYMIGWL